MGMTTHIEARDALVKRLYGLNKTVGSATKLSIINQSADELARMCEWKRSFGTYHGDCGFIQIFLSGEPEQNAFHFCPHCGGRISVTGTHRD